MSFIWWLALGMILIDILLKLLPPVCYWMTMAGLSSGSWSYYVNSSLRSPHRCVYTPRQRLVTFRLDFAAPQDITHNLDLGRYIKKQETTSDTRLILLIPALARYKVMSLTLRYLSCVGLGLSFASSHLKSSTKLVRQKGTKTVFILVLYELTLLQHPNPLCS